MAAKKGNGHDPTAAIVEVLERIEKRLGNVETEARATNQEIHAFREETREDLGAVRADVASLITEVSSLRSPRRGRLGKLEEAVFKRRGS